MRDLAPSLLEARRWVVVFVPERKLEKSHQNQKTKTVNQSLEPRLISIYGPKEVRGPSYMACEQEMVKLQLA